MGTGVIYNFANLHLRDDKQAADDAGDDAEFCRIENEIENVRLVDGILFGTGFAAISVGVVLLLLDDDGEVTRLAAQVLKSLIEAHAFGIVHRDIKPSNLMICK